MNIVRKLGQYLSDGRKAAVGLLAGGAAMNALPGQPQAQAADRDHPNIIFILADDLGWTDLNCRPVTRDSKGMLYYDSTKSPTPAEKYDSTFYRTPQLALLRHDAMRFTNAHVPCPYCKASRVSIMTGKYPMRAGLPDNNARSNTAALSLAETTIAEALDNHGVDYRSAFIGKWHLTTRDTLPDYQSHNPEKQGFELNIGGSWSASPLFIQGSADKPQDDDTSYWWSGTVFNYPRPIVGYGLPGLEGYHQNFEENEHTRFNVYRYAAGEDEYLTDRLTWEAVDFIKDASQKGRPFFLFLSHYAPHNPISGKKSVIDGYKDPPAPVAHYRFENTTPILANQNCLANRSYEGHQYDGTIYPEIKDGANAIQYGHYVSSVDSKYGSYLLLNNERYFEVNGIDDPGKPGDRIQFHAGVLRSDPRTCSAWIKCTPQQAGGPVLSWGTESPTNESAWIVGMNGEGKLYLDSGKSTFCFDHSANLKDGNWHYIAAVYENGNLSLYVSDHNKLISTSVRIPVDTVRGGYVRVGADTGSGRFAGNIDEVSIYNQALTAAQVERVYVSPQPHVDSVYAAMIESIDEGIGQIRQTLAKYNLADNTIIIFFSDNGGTATTSNHPLAGYKFNLYEGGVRVPMLVYWPGVTNAAPAPLTCDIPVSGIDILPTLVQMAYPEINPDAQYLLDGKSLVGLIKGRQTTVARVPLNGLFFNNAWSNLAILGTDSYNYKYSPVLGLKKLYDPANNLMKEAELTNDQDPGGAITEVMKKRLAAWDDSLKIRLFINNTPETTRYTTIASALAAADTQRGTIKIQLPPCTYFERITIDRNITLCSQNPDDPRIVAATIIDGSYLRSVITANSDCTIEGITITNGFASDGGGIDCCGKSVILRKCRIIGNTATGNGGGIYNNGPSGTVENCTISRNQADGNGGGLYNCTGTIADCIISGNSASTGGGLFFSDCRNGSITNCTITDNAAARSGGIDSNSETIPTVTRCILWGNSSGR